MKKKMIVLLAAICAVSMAAACGTKKDSSEEQETTGDTNASDEQTGAVSYDVEECVKLGEYKGLEISLSSYEVTDEDVKEDIENTLASYPSYEDTDKTTVEEGDIVNIDYEGLKDGVAFDGGTAQGYNLEIGSHSFIDGFEDGLVGKKVGEKVALDLTFPEGYQSEELAGQAVVFNVTINKIVERNYMTYDTVTDEFVASNFISDGYQNVDDMKKGVREKLESNNEANKQTDTQNAVFEKLHENCTVTLPDGLLDQKIQEYMEQLTASLTSNDMELTDYLSSMGTTEEEFNEQVSRYLEESLINQLIMEAIAKKENIGADEEGYAQYKQGVVADYGFESEDALVEQYGEEYIRNAYIGDKALEFVIDNAKVTYDAGAAAETNTP